MKNCLLITGASGFVGSHAVDYALNNSRFDLIVATDVRDMDYRYKGGDELRLNFIKADLTKKEDVGLLIKAMKKLTGYCATWTVWHIGGCFNYSAPRDVLYRVNVLGTKLLLEALNDSNLAIRRFVFWSGAVIYGDLDRHPEKLPATEDFPVLPKDNYGWSKREAEEWVMFFHRKFQLPATIMRLAAIYGPRSRYGMANAFYLQGRGQLAPVLVGNPFFKVALIHAEDVIRVADFLGRAPESNGEIYNVADKGDYTLGEMSLFVGKLLNNKPFASFSLPGGVLKLLIKLVQKIARRVGGTPVIDPELGNMVLSNWSISNEKLKNLAQKHNCWFSLLKYPDTLDGLRESIEWYKKEWRL